MTNRLKTLLGVLILSAMALPAALAGEEGDQKTQEAWAKYMTANENHEFLAKGAGCWDVETTMYEGLGKEPVKSKAFAKDTMIFDGRYLKSHFVGEINGMPFKGLGYTGYDNAAKQFVTTWMDSMGTGIAYMTGTLDASGKSITFVGEAVNPLTGKNQKYKSINTMVDDNKQAFVMFDVAADGTEVKTFEMVYTRKKCDGSCKTKGCSAACKGKAKSCKVAHKCDETCKKKGCTAAKAAKCCKAAKSCKAAHKCDETCKKKGCTAAKAAKCCKAAHKCDETCKKKGCTAAKDAKKCKAAKSCKAAHKCDETCKKKGCTAAKAAKKCNAAKSCKAAHKCDETCKKKGCTAAKDAKKCPVTGKTGTCTAGKKDAEKAGCPHAKKKKEDTKEEN